MTGDFERRLERIENKLDEKIVYRDVWESHLERLEDKIDNAATSATKETTAAMNLIAERLVGLTKQVETQGKRLDDAEEDDKTKTRLVLGSVATALIGVSLFVMERVFQ